MPLCKRKKEGKCEAAASGCSARSRAASLGCGAPSACLAGGGHSHFIISPKPKEACAPQSPAGCR